MPSRAVFDAVLQPDGKIVAGINAPGGALVRYDGAGVLDATYGTAGFATLPGAIGQAYEGHLQRQPDGHLLTVRGVPGGAGVGRFDANGAFDAAFAPCGLALAIFAGGNSTVTEPLLQPDGHFVLGSLAAPFDDGLGHLTLVRFGNSASALACTPAPTGRSKLTFKPGDKMKWKWVGPGSLAKSDFGPPTAGVDLVLCAIEEATGAPFAVLAIPGTTTVCNDNACWLESASGFLGTLRTDSGKLRMKALAPAGAPGKLVVTGRGYPAMTPSFPLPAPIVARMTRGDSGGCWEATFSTPKRNNPVNGFVAVSD